MTFDLAQARELIESLRRETDAKHAALTEIYHEARKGRDVTDVQELLRITDNIMDIASRATRTTR